MPTWDELFRQGFTFDGVEQEVAMMARLLSVELNLPPAEMKFWDLGCGTGRHTVYLARRGYAVYASDVSPKALEVTRETLTREHLKGTLAEADMEVNPFPGVQFHGIILWNVVQHADIAKITRVFADIKAALAPRGYFLLSAKSTNAEEVGKGKQVEANTYVMESGAEAGVPHHYFSRVELEGLLAPLDITHLVEVQHHFHAAAVKIFIATDTLPYRNGHWVAMAKKPREQRRAS